MTTGLFDQFIILSDDETKRKFKEAKTQAEFNNIFHTSDDRDTSKNASHHSLGSGDTQASPGRHLHDGRESQILPATNLSILIGRTLITTPSGTFTAETVIATVVVDLKKGKTYKVLFEGKYETDAATITSVLLAIKEDSIGGSARATRRIPTPPQITTAATIAAQFALYTAAVDETKTFVATLSRTGTGNINSQGSSTDPSKLEVTYDSG